MLFALTLSGMSGTCQKCKNRRNDSNQSDDGARQAGEGFELFCRLHWQRMVSDLPSEDEPKYNRRKEKAQCNRQNQNFQKIVEN